jgi:hypothetical protein
VIRPMVVKDFGCRPIATRRHILGPTSEKPPRKEPARDGSGSGRECYTVVRSQEVLPVNPNHPPGTGSTVRRAEDNTCSSGLGHRADGAAQGCRAIAAQGGGLSARCHPQGGAEAANRRSRCHLGRYAQAHLHRARQRPRRTLMRQGWSTAGRGSHWRWHGTRCRRRPASSGSCSRERVQRCIPQLPLSSRPSRSSIATPTAT